MAALSEITICEMALSRIGVSQRLSGDVNGTLDACTDTSVAKQQCDLWYERCRRRALTEFAWQFARKFATLVLVDDGTNEIWEDEWDNAYAYPADCLMTRRFVNDRGIGYYKWGCNENVWPWAYHYEWKFVVRVHNAQKVILTDVDQTDANMEYTEDLTDVTRFTEPFASGLSWLIASEIAIPLDVNPQKAQGAIQAYYATSRQAASFTTNEEQPYPEGDQAFLNARGW